MNIIKKRILFSLLVILTSSALPNSVTIRNTTRNLVTYSVWERQNPAQSKLEPKPSDECSLALEGTIRPDETVSFDTSKNTSLQDKKLSCICSIQFSAAWGMLSTAYYTKECKDVDLSLTTELTGKKLTMTVKPTTVKSLLTSK